MSLESRRKMSLAQKGKIKSVEHRRKLAESQRGKKHTSERKNKIAIALLWRKMSDETREKMRVAALKRKYVKQEVIKQGDKYFARLCPSHPCAVNGRVLEHRLVMETILLDIFGINIYLDSEQVVHHIDNSGDNNTAENVLLFKNNQRHTLFHHKFNKLKKKLHQQNVGTSSVVCL